MAKLMSGKSLAENIEKQISAYYFYLYAREELKSESLAVWEEFLGSLH